MNSGRSVNAVRAASRLFLSLGLLALLAVGCGGAGGGDATPAASSAAAAPAVPTTSTIGEDAPVVVETTYEDLPPPALDGSRLPKGVAGALPEGTYSYTVTRDDVAASNPPDFLADFIFAENVGTYTWRVAKGRWHADQETTPKPVISSLDGTYVADGDIVTFYFPSGIAYDYADMVQDDGEPAIPQAPVERFHWRVDDGAIYLTPVDATDPLAAATMARHEWRPVAGEAGT